MSNYMHAYMIVKNLPDTRWNDVQRWIYEDHNGDLRYTFAGYTAWDGEMHFDGVNDVNWSLDIVEMMEFSKAFPEALIEVHYSNGYIEDECRDYWKDGKLASYSPEIIWPEFNANDLTEVYL